MFEPVPGDEGRTWQEEDFEYLKITYGDNYSFDDDYNYYYFDDSYIVHIPEDMIPPKIKLSKGMIKDDILAYIRKWNSCREGLFNLIVANHGYPHDKEASLYEIIEKRLLKIAEETIMNTDERTLAEHDFDPFADLDEWDETFPKGFVVFGIENEDEVTTSFQSKNTGGSGES
jgi:hypothetical protein